MTKIPHKRLAQTLKEHQRAAYISAILDAGEAVISRDTFEKAKMSDIAKETGIAVGTLYNYFESKDDVFRAIKERATSEFLSVVHEAKQSTENPKEELRAIVNATFEFIRKRGRLFDIFRQIEEQHARDKKGEKGFAAVLCEVLQKCQQEKLIRPELDLEQILSIFGGMIGGTIRFWIDSERSFNLLERTDLIIDIFFQGASPRS